MDGLNECNCDTHKKKVGVELLYNSVKTGSQLVLRPDQLETRCGRESQHPAEWDLRPPIEQLGIRPVREKMLDWGTCPREAGPPGPWLSSPEEQERNAVMANRVGVNMLQFFLVSNSLSYTTLSIKWEVYFTKRTVSLVYYCVEYTTYNYKQNLVLNNPQGLVWHKTPTNQDFLILAKDFQRFS